MKNAYVYFINIDFWIVFLVVQTLISVRKYHSKGEKSICKGRWENY